MRTRAWRACTKPACASWPSAKWAIAAAGDVNVNAIAPGIAAALLATVAGLGVAIPSLFGYNYLASRIKNISSDMQIFVDEFVTRVAETYGAR
jgi:biopolymer transport protein ExbB